MKKRIILTMAVSISILSANAFTGLGGGTKNDPYQITNADELFEIRNELDAHYKLMSDIDIASFIAEDNPVQGWSPIGNAATPFVGSLDGNNKTLKGLYINRPSVDNVGLFGCVAGGKIGNMTLVNANVTGNNNVGTIIGMFRYDYFLSDNEVNNVIVQNGIVNSVKKNAGGILGAISCPNFTDVQVLNDSWEPSIHTIVSGCGFTGIVKADESNAGGICGYATSGKFLAVNHSGSRYTHAVNKSYITDNYVDAQIISNGLSGGIIAFMESVSLLKQGMGLAGQVELDFNAQRNVSQGLVYGNNYVCGIIGRIKPEYDGNSFGIVDNNVAALDTIRKDSSKEIYRITNKLCPNNYAYAGMVALYNSTNISLEDNDYNGTSYGLKTLKKRATYEGLGFDFGNQWAIREGESFPYNIYQSEMPEVIEFQSGSRAYIKGKANGTGQVYVFVGGNLFESYIVNNEWKVDLGNIPTGTGAKVSVAVGGKMPSLQVSAIAEAGSSNPSLMTGDANGDGEVDAADVVSIINHIIGKVADSFNEKNADVNGDGQVLVDDAVSTVELIMNNQ